MTEFTRTIDGLAGTDDWLVKNMFNERTIKLNIHKGDFLRNFLFYVNERANTNCKSRIVTNITEFIRTLHG